MNQEETPKIGLIWQWKESGRSRKKVNIYQHVKDAIIRFIEKFNSVPDLVSLPETINVDISVLDRIKIDIQRCKNINGVDLFIWGIDGSSNPQKISVNDSLKELNIND